MKNQPLVFEELLKENIEIFKSAFLKISKNMFYDDEMKRYKHPGEFGVYREAICKRFLRFFIPSKFEIHNGFLINSDNERSSQCDIVIFDSSSTPFIQSPDFQRFYPVQTVVSVGEVKSIMSKSEFKTAINKLANVKKMRCKIDNPIFLFRDLPGAQMYSDVYAPDIYPRDSIFTFLICQKFDFDYKNIVNEIDGLYEKEIELHNKHNLIFSIEDGILLYYDANNMSLMYPNINENKFKNRFVMKGDNEYVHFKYFMSYLFQGVCTTSILFPEMKGYIGSVEGGFNINQD